MGNSKLALEQTSPAEKKFDRSIDRNERPVPPQPQHKQDGFPASKPLICEQFASSSCLLTASRVSPVLGPSFAPGFFDLMKELEKIDKERSKPVIWALSRGFQEPDPKVRSLERERAARHFKEFCKIVVETGNTFSSDWFKQQSAFAVAHVDKKMVEEKASEYNFEPNDFRSATYNASKFFRSMTSRTRRSIWSQVINPPFHGGVDQKSRQRVVTAFVAQSDNVSSLDVAYFSHNLDGNEQPVAIKRDFTSEARDRAVINIYRTAKSLNKESKSNSFEESVFELFRIGFLVLNFEELVNLE